MILLTPQLQELTMKKAVYTFNINNEIKEDALLKTEELAQALGVSKQTIRRWHFVGYLRGFKMGPHLVRYRWGDVQEWLEDKQGCR
jgi:excisionase family DNA binding protein